MGYEFFVEEIIVPSAPVPSINNDQSLILALLKVFQLRIYRYLTVASDRYPKAIVKNNSGRFSFCEQSQ